MAPRRAQRPAGDGADVLLELVDLAAVQGPVAGVVDARRELVDQQAAVVALEQLHAEHADIVEGGQQRGGDPLGLGDSAWRSPWPARWCGAGCRSRGGFRSGDRGRSRRRGRGRRSPPARGGSRRASRRWRAPAERGERRGRVTGPLDPGLALAVVAAAPGLEQQRRRRSAAARRADRLRRQSPRTPTVGAPAALRKVFSSSRSWAMASARAPGATVGAQPPRGLGQGARPARSRTRR